MSCTLDPFLEEQTSQSEDNASTATSLPELQQDVVPKLADDSFTGPCSDFAKYMARNPGAECVVGIRGNWYDVSSFRFKHPGGQTLLERSHGKDVSDMFEAFHVKDVLRGWRPVGHYPRSELVAASPIIQIFEDLRRTLTQASFFECCYSFYLKKFLAVFILWGLSALELLYLPQNAGTIILAGLTLGMAWQQCGFLMHDLMHSEFTHNRKIDRWFGFFFGSIVLGIEAHWWRDEHFDHHAFTNVIEKSTRTICDTQMQEDVWAQDQKLFEMYAKYPFSKYVWVNAIVDYLRSVQHYTFLPFCVGIGRIAIIVNGLFKQRQWYVYTAHLVHTLWLAMFLRYLIPNHFKHQVLFYVAAALYEGIIHVQLLASHYGQPWYYLEDVFTHKLNWYQLQIVTNCNIENSRWMDWFYGGLNYHIEHHLFPLMPRHRLRDASHFVKEACLKAHLPYTSASLTATVAQLLKHLKLMGLSYTERLCSSTQKVAVPSKLKVQ